MTGFIAYHGLSAGAHQQRVDTLAPQGYRPVCLNVSGEPDDASYAAVWLDEPGPAWFALHGLSAQDFQTRFNELTGEGYAPRIVSATGTADSAIFAAVFERGGDTGWFARHGLRWGPDVDPDTITYETRRARDAGYVPLSLAMYGAPDDRRYAGVWVENIDHVAWSFWLADARSYQRHFDALVSGGLRPAALSVGSDGAMLSAWRDDRIGTWWARHGIDARDYQREFDTRVAEGLRPIIVSAGGDGDSRTYAAVFAHGSVPTARAFTATGSVFDGSAQVDADIESFMRKYGIRAGTMAVARGGVLVGARGYTWAEPGYPVTRPDTRFRIASVSKLFAAAMASRLVERQALNWDTPAFAAAGITTALPSGVAADPSMRRITIEQLVLRTSHLPRDLDTDMRGIAARLAIGDVPIPDDQLLRYLHGLPLVGAIPPDGLYSNTAFFLLTAVIENVTGRSFVDALAAELLSPMGITDVTRGFTPTGARQFDEVADYDHPDVGSSQLDYSPTALAPNAYGGSFVLEQPAGAGAGGLVTSSPTIARVIGRYPVWNGTAVNLAGRELATRYGTFDGISSGASCRMDGFDIAFLFNRRVGDAQHDEIRDAINTVSFG